MKEKNGSIRDKLISYGIDLVKQIILTILKSKLMPKKKESSEKKVERKKQKRHLLRKILFALLFKELVLDRLQAKIVLKPSSRDFSWLLDFPLRKHLVDLNDYTQTLNKDSKILDLGSGSGYFAIDTAKYLNSDGKVYCVDINFDVLEKLQIKAAEEQISNIEFHRADIEKLPFENDTFDAAFMNMTIGQIPDKIKALSEVKRVLKNGGYLFITELLIDPYYCLRSNLLSLATRANFKDVSEKGNFLNYTLILRKA